ncbi:MAG: cobalamin-binding protein [Mariprofundaceae bacterium]
MRWLAFCLLLLSAPMAQAAERILALSPHACEILFAVGAGEEIVGAVDYCDYPDAARALPRVGNFNRVNAEAALRLDPGMAVVFDHRLPGLARLESLGVVIIQSHPRSVDEMLNDVARLGRVTGHEQQALRLVESLSARLQAIRGRQKEAVRVFYEAWSEPLISSGKPSFISDILRLSGALNVFGELAIESPRVSVEAVIKAVPDVILVPAEADQLASRKAFWQGYLGKRVEVIAVDQDALSRPGPRLIDAIEALSARLSVIERHD